MFRRERIRLGAVLAILAALAVTLAAPPAAAAGPAGWGEARDLAAGLWPRVLHWLGLGPAAPKCDAGAHIDPNGCPKAGLHIDPNGAPGLPAWPKFNADTRPTMFFQKETRVVEKPFEPVWQIILANPNPNAPPI